MVQINFARKEINCKLVYYGPGLSGKTTNLEMVHERTPQANKGELTSISTDGDRTLFFDFMPLDLGEIAGMQTKFHLYTVPGQVYYNSTRKLVLLGADGVIFVADSSRSKMAENLESLDNLRENLAEMGKDIASFPVVLQWNKRDMDDAATEEELDAELNKHGAPTFNAIANKGEGVFQTLKALSALVLKNISSTEGSMSSTKRSAAAAPAATSASAKGSPAAEAAPGLAIERNEVGTGAATTGAPATSGGAEEWRSGDGALAAAAQARPVDSSQSVEAAPNSVATRAPKRSPERGGAARQAPARGADEVLASKMTKKARPARPGNTLHREVKVIGGRPGGRPAESANGPSSAMIVGGVLAVVAATGAAWFFLV